MLPGLEGPRHAQIIVRIPADFSMKINDHDNLSTLALVPDPVQWSPKETLLRGEWATEIASRRPLATTQCEDMNYVLD